MIGAKRLASARANSWPTLIVALTSLILAGCDGPSKSDLTGTFSRTTAAATETIQIKADGTFAQVVESADGQIWTLTNTWVLKPRGITFNLFYETYDIEKQATVIPPVKVAFRNCYWRAGSLVCSDVGTYVFQKTTKQ